ncbi:hypothetical protein GQ457_03G035630 [Hibiscus cannabinus]
MARKRVKITYIKNDVTRNAAYKKIKNDIVKKLSELTILCGVRACVVLYPSGSDSQPEMVNQENFLKQRITKVTEQLEQLREKNRKMELNQIMYQNLGRDGPLNVKEEDLVELEELIDDNLKAIDKRIEALAKQEN